jgi:predicted sulfurtransferase
MRCYFEVYITITASTNIATNQVIFSIMSSDDNCVKAGKYQRKLANAIKRLHSEAAKDDPDELIKARLRAKVEKWEHALALLPVDASANKKESEDISITEVVQSPSNVSLLLFYAYVEPAWSHAHHKETLHWAEDTLSALGVTGRLRIAREGFNGTLTGSYDSIRAFTDALRQRDNGYFAHMSNDDDFKITDNLPEGQRFPKLKVFNVSELVNYGLGVDNAPSVTKGGIHLNPKEYHAKLLEENTVVIDIRNSYEAEIGRFAPTSGATYIDPKMRVSTDFPAWAKDNIDQLKDKQVLMYCTGGIRCERASALFRSLGHDRVYQLKGRKVTTIDHFDSSTLIYP